jgi:hypothetical protein
LEKRQGSAENGDCPVESQVCIGMTGTVAGREENGHRDESTGRSFGLGLEACSRKHDRYIFIHHRIYRPGR